MEKVWEIKDPDAYLAQITRRVRKKRPASEKDPARAYGLSLLYWGGGQLYNDQFAKGAVFLTAMVFLLAIAVLVLTNSNTFFEVLGERHISLSDTFFGLEVFLFLVTLFWVCNAGDAYHHARRTLKAPFRGVKSKVTPALASLALPGWGQFLNGQQFKGSIFSGLAVIGIFSVLSVTLTFLAWPLLDASDTRFLVEGVFAVCLVILPFVPLLWLLGAYDAYKVSSDELKKERLWERIKATYYRGRTQGLVRGVVPQIKGSFLLILVLGFFVVVVYYWFPKDFYAEMLTAVKNMLTERGMTITPGLIERLLAWMAGAR